MKIFILKDILISNNERSTKYKKNIILSSASQILSVCVSLLLVPVTLNFLGVQEYGVWITLTTIITWFTFFDIGLGHGLRNKYAEAKATNNEIDAKKYVSTAFFFLILISSWIFLTFVIINFFINWAAILNAPTELSSELKVLALWIIGFFSLRFVLNIVNTILTADQEPGIVSLIGFLGQVLSLGIVFLITRFAKPSLLYIGIALSVSQIIPLFIAFVLLFSNRYKTIKPSIKFFSRQHIKSIFSLGIRFFLIQITGLILFQSNNIIIAHVSGLEKVTDFNIAYKYLNILFIAFTTFVNPLWSASTEAYVKGDIHWIKGSIKQLNIIWFLIIIGGVALIFISPMIYRLWLHDSLYPDVKLQILLLFYFVCMMRSYLYRNFMNGVGKIKLQFYITFLQSLLHVPIAIVFGRIFGVFGVILTMSIWAFINSIWEPIQFNKIVTKTAAGIWNQ